MRKLSVFNSISLDGYFTDGQGDMSWAHKHDPEWEAFTAENAKGGGELVFGRKTYDLMVSFWPTSAAAETMPAVAERMNDLPKVVFSRTLDAATWANTELIKSDIEGAMRAKKQASGPDMVIMGSGTIVAQLTEARLIDEYQLIVVPIALGSGRSLFEGVSEPLHLELCNSRIFGNGNVVVTYRPSPHSHVQG